MYVYTHYTEGITCMQSNTCKLLLLLLLLLLLIVIIIIIVNIMTLWLKRRQFER